MLFELPTMSFMTFSTLAASMSIQDSGLVGTGLKTHVSAQLWTDTVRETLKGLPHN